MAQNGEDAIRHYLSNVSKDSLLFVPIGGGIVARIGGVQMEMVGLIRSPYPEAVYARDGDSDRPFEIGMLSTWVEKNFQDRDKIFDALRLAPGGEASDAVWSDVRKTVQRIEDMFRRERRDSRAPPANRAMTYWE